MNGKCNATRMTAVSEKLVCLNQFMRREKFGMLFKRIVPFYISFRARTICTEEQQWIPVSMHCFHLDPIDCFFRMKYNNITSNGRVHNLCMNEATVIHRRFWSNIHFFHTKTKVNCWRTNSINYLFLRQL